MEAHSSDREIRRPRTLPGSRAVVGGTLMAVAAVGVFAAYADATEPPTSTFLVAAGSIRPGDRIDADDVREARGSVPELLAGRVFADPSEVVGRAALSPIDDGDLLQASMLTDDAGDGHEVALVLPRSQVAVGRLKQGERIDVFVTSEGRTDSVVQGAMVVQIDAGDDGSLTSERELTLVVALPDGGTVAALVHALRTGDVTVVRSTFGETAGQAPLSYPPSPAEPGPTGEAAP